MNEATNGYKRKHGLTIEQRNAIDVLLAGKTDQEAADTVGTHRVTITRWRLYDPWFAAELNRRRQETWGVTTERLRAMLPKALNVLAEALDGDDALRAATQIVRLTGVGRLDPPTGPTDPEQIIGELIEARAAQKKRFREQNQNVEDMMAELQEGPGHLQKLAAQDLATARDEIELEISEKLRDEPPE